MKYRLPGIYLGNISLDLFMEYMKNEELNDQVTSNDYYKTDSRTKNIQVFRVDFSFNSQSFNIYTHNIRDLESVRETVRTYFRDIIKNDSDPLFDYDATVDAIVFSVQTTVTYNNPILFDTLVQPSIYGSYITNSEGLNEYMVSIKGLGGEDLNSYISMKSYIENPLTINPPEIQIYDLRFQTPQLIRNLYVSPPTLKEDSVVLLEQVLDINDDIVTLKENKLYFGKKTLLNMINNQGMFSFKDKLGGITNSPNKNIMMQDIENNRKIKDKSIQMKMLSSLYSPFFKGRAGIVREQVDQNSKVSIVFSKYDHYDIKRKYELITTIPISNDIRFEDMEPSLIDTIDDSLGDIYEYNHDALVVYTNLINTNTLPKFKAIHTLVGSENRYYIFDVIRGEVPEYIDVSSSDDKTLCLLDVYSKNYIRVKNKNKVVTSHSLTYNISTNQNNIFRTISVGGKTYYIKLADSENDPTAYIIVPSNTTKSFMDSTTLLSDFSFANLGFTVTANDIYPISYKSDGAGGTVVDKWGMDLITYDGEKLNLEFNDGDSSDAITMNTFMDITTLSNRLYLKMPVEIHLTELTEDVMVTMRSKKLLSANDYLFDTVGYWSTDNVTSNYRMEPPILSEYNTDETKPYANISDYIAINNFDETYSKIYYIVNEYDQSKIYKVTDRIVHDPSSDNPSPYNNTFTNINSKLSSVINNNTINLLVGRFGSSITVDDRGKIITSDIMGVDLLDDIKNEFQRGFNNIFYGIKNYTYDYKVGEITELEKLNFLKNSLIGYDSLNKLLDSFLKYNFISTNKYTYTIDKSFKFGFFVKKDENRYLEENRFTDWIGNTPNIESDSNKLNTLQRIKEYEITTSNSEISEKLKMDWVKNNMLKNNNKNTTTGYIAEKNRVPATLKNINNKEVLSQAFSMLMDQKYNATKVIESFTKTNVTKLSIVDTKEKDLFYGEHNEVRFINSNQNIDVMIKTYLSGFNRKVGV